MRHKGRYGCDAAHLFEDLIEAHDCRVLSIGYVRQGGSDKLGLICGDCAQCLFRAPLRCLLPGRHEHDVISQFGKNVRVADGEKGGADMMIVTKFSFNAAIESAKAVDRRMSRTGSGIGVGPQAGRK